MKRNSLVGYTSISKQSLAQGTSEGSTPAEFCPNQAGLTSKAVKCHIEHHTAISAKGEGQERMARVHFHEYHTTCYAMQRICQHVRALAYVREGPVRLLLKTHIVRPNIHLVLVSATTKFGFPHLTSIDSHTMF